jgi:hypothetical protein
VKRLRVVLGLAVLSGLLTACGQLGPSIPGQPTGGAHSSPQDSVTATAAPTPTGPRVAGAAAATSAQLGVQIYWHEVTDPYAVKANADRLFDYVLGLGANSVGISFPIYTDGRRPTKVYTKDGITPTPASLQSLIDEAKARGLRVMVRPIIDEANIADGTGAWRGSIAPRDMSSWFASYQQTLSPFLAAAQAAHAEAFVIGSELDSLVGQSTQWRALEAAAAAVFSGRLAYADNWGAWATGRPGVPGADPGLDAYPELKLSDAATVAQISAAFSAWLLKRPDQLADTVVQEVGIAATPGAYKHPAAWGTTAHTLAPQIQANWFLGACEAIKSMHMSGIYFWNLDAWADPAKAATYDSGSFIGRGDSAIKTCFAKGWPGQ